MILKDRVESFKLEVLKFVEEREKLQVQRENVIKNQNQRFSTCFDPDTNVKTIDPDDLINIIIKESLYLRSMRAGVGLNDFLVLKEIGQGAYAKVSLVKHRASGRVYAMKQIDKQKLNSKDGVRIRTERAVMLHFNSDYVVRLHYAFQDQDNLYFVMDYAGGGDLQQLLNTIGAAPPSWARRWFCEMLIAVFVLHNVDAEALVRERCGQAHKLFNSSTSSVLDSYEVQQIQAQPSDQEQTRLRFMSFADDKDFQSVSDDENETPVTFQQLSKVNFQTQNRSLAQNPLNVNLRVSNDEDSSLPLQIQLRSKRDLYYIHRDLKPQNFFIASTGRIILGDFGYAYEMNRNFTQQECGRNVVYKSQTKIDTIVGTLSYISPEQIIDGVLSKLVDYWSLGCILYEILTGEIAFHVDSIDKLYDKFQNMKYQQQLPERYEIDDDSWDLISQLLEEPSYRLGNSSSLNQLIFHRFLTKGIDPKDIMNLNHPLLQKVLNTPQEMTDEDYENLPLLPLESFMKIIPSPKIVQSEDIGNSFESFTKQNLVITIESSDDLSSQLLHSSGPSQSEAMVILSPTLLHTNCGSHFEIQQHPILKQSIDTDQPRIKDLLMNQFAGINYVDQENSNEQQQQIHRKLCRKTGSFAFPRQQIEDAQFSEPNFQQFRPFQEDQ